MNEAVVLLLDPRVSASYKGALCLWLCVLDAESALWHYALTTVLEWYAL